MTVVEAAFLRVPSRFSPQAEDRCLKGDVSLVSKLNLRFTSRTRRHVGKHSQNTAKQAVATMSAALRARAHASSALLAAHVLPQPALRCQHIVPHAKKKGGGNKGGKKKGGQQKQGSGIPKAGQVQQTPWKAPEKVMELMLMIESYRCVFCLASSCAQNAAVRPCCTHL